MPQAHFLSLSLGSVLRTSMCNPELELWPGVALLEVQTELECAQEVLVMQDGMCVGSKGGELSDLLSLCCRCVQRYVLPTLPVPNSEVSLLLLLSCSVLSNSLQPYELQHTRLPCPSLSPRACSNSCPLSRWYHPAISCSVALFSSCLEFLIWTWPFMLFQWYIYIYIMIYM